MKTFTFLHNSGKSTTIKAHTELEAWDKMIVKFHNTLGWAIVGVSAS